MDYNVSSKIEQRGVLAGMLLGAARIRENNFFIPHSKSQEDYLFFKQHLLEQITLKPVNISQGKTKTGEVLFRIEPKLIPLTRVLIKKLYPGKIRRITRSFLNLLTPQGIAIWFMDKGSKSFKKENGEIHALEVTLNTYLSKSENELIVTYFTDLWGFRWGLSKAKASYRLRMGTKEGKKFLNFLRPYIHPSMLYKVQTSYNITATT